MDDDRIVSVRPCWNRRREPLSYVAVALPYNLIETRVCDCVFFYSIIFYTYPIRNENNLFLLKAKTEIYTCCYFTLFLVFFFCLF